MTTNQKDDHEQSELIRQNVLIAPAMSNTSVKNLLLRLTTFGNEHSLPKVAQIDFTTPISKSEKEIDDLYYVLLRKYNQFASRDYNHDYGFITFEECYRFKEMLRQKEPVIIEHINKTIENWTNCGVIKQMDEIEPYFKELELLLEQLSNLINQELYRVGSVLYNQARDDVEKL